MDGKEIPFDESLRLWGDDDSLRRVDATTLDNGYRVSTVLLVWDHGGGGGPPVIFESLVTKSGSNWTYVDRYSTLEQAKQGHLELVKKYK
jgi:hypothetical protein